MGEPVQHGTCEPFILNSHTDLVVDFGPPEGELKVRGTFSRRDGIGFEIGGQCPPHQCGVLMFYSSGVVLGCGGQAFALCGISTGGSGCSEDTLSGNP